jgi:Tfp pilus assembly protein PilX
VPTAQTSADAQVRGHEQQQQQHGQRPHAPSDVFTSNSVRIKTSSRIIIVVINNNCCALHSALRADEATLEFLDLYRMDVLFTA